MTPMDAYGTGNPWASDEEFTDEMDRLVLVELAELLVPLIAPYEEVDI